jgi:hypothetical protein
MVDAVGSGLSSASGFGKSLFGAEALRGSMSTTGRADHPIVVSL